MTTTVKSDDEKLTCTYDTMANLMADIATKGTAGYSLVSVSTVALQVVYEKAL